MVISTGHRHRPLGKKTDNKLVGQIHQYIANIYLPGETIAAYTCVYLFSSIHSYHTYNDGKDAKKCPTGFG